MNLKVLKNKNLLLVILGQFVSGFGTMMQSFALSLYVFKKTGSAALFSTVIVVAILPRVLISPFAGVIADRVSRKKMIVLMDFLSSAIVTIFAAIFLITGELNLVSVYIMVISLSIISAFFTPSMGAIIPDIVKRKDLADANSARAMTESILSLASPIIAGVLYAAFGIFIIMIVNAVSFFSSAVSEMFIKIKNESLSLDDKNGSYFKSIKEGLVFAKTLPELILITGIAFIANFAVAPIFSVALPIVLLDEFKVSEWLYGLFQSVGTIGLLIAPLFAAKIIKKFHYSKIMWSVLILDGVLCLIIAVLSISGLFATVMINYIAMLVVINLFMATIIWVNLGLSTAFQLLVPKEMMGRMSSLLGTVSMLASPLGFALMGMLLESNKGYSIIGIYALLLVAVGIFSKIGFNNLERKGKMDMTTGLELAEEEAA